MSRLPRFRALLSALCSVLASCSSDELTRPGAYLPAYATGSTPSVTSTDPADGKQGTTLSVQVVGSGFDKGSRTDFLLNGQVTAGIKTNATTYVSSKQLVANITIAPDAITDAYDVAVTTSAGRKGIGTELFTVHTMTDLGTFGGASSKARGVNSLGVITGAADRADGHARAFSWTEAGGLVDIGTMGGDTDGSAWAINDNGLVVGLSSGRNGGGAPAVWVPNSGSGYAVQSLGLGSVAAYDVNNAGVLVGDTWDASGANQPFSWSSGAGVALLPLLPTAYRGRADAISGDGTIAGWNVTSVGDSTLPAVWTTDGAVVPLRLPAGNPEGQALGINDFNVVVGQVWTRTSSGGTSTLAVRWRPDPNRPGAWLPPDLLGTLGGAESTANDINNAGQIVGASDIGIRKSTGPTGHGFLWQESRGMQDLGALTKLETSAALHINDPTDGGSPVIVGKSGSHAVRWRLP